MLTCVTLLADEDLLDEPVADESLEESDEEMDDTLFVAEEDIEDVLLVEEEVVWACKR